MALSADASVKFYGNITGSGNLEIARHITGSSISTGSFGSLVVADKVQGSLTVDSKETESGAETIVAENFLGSALIKVYSGHASTNRLVGIHMSASTAGADYSVGLDRATNSFVVNRGSMVSGTEIVNVTSSMLTVTGDMSASGDHYVEGNLNIGTISNSSSSLAVSGSMRSSQYSMSGSTTTSIDFRRSNNWEIPLGTSVTISSSYEGSCIGQNGILAFRQDPTGGRTITLPATWKTPRGAAIAYDTGGEELNIISYYVLSSTEVLINYMGDFS